MLNFRNIIIRKNIMWNVVKKLSNLNASIVILLLISCISILGTVIEQDQTTNYYQLHYPINNHRILDIINWKIILILGLDHIYITWWFLSLLGLFFCTLIACTLSRQLPSLKHARHWKFLKSSLSLSNDLEQDLYLNQIHALSNIIYLLNTKNYYVFHRKKNIYSYKGLIGRIGPIFVHFSIIIIFVGSIVGFLWGYTAQQMIPNGELFHIQNIIQSGINSSLPNNIIGKIDQFSIEYYNDRSIKQFHSHISLFNQQGKHLKEKSISVNSPLRFHGLTFYQTDWRIHGLRLKINNQHYTERQLKKIPAGRHNIWLYKLSLHKNQYILVVVTNLKDKILLFNESGELLHKIDINENIDIYNTNLNIEEIMTYTGIQIKTDPGIFYVYTSFFILMISIMISYISYSQIWIYGKKEQVYIKGVTNRGKLIFEEELISIQKKYIKTINNLRN